MVTSLPLVEELSPAPSPEAIFQLLSGLPHCLFLDSALRHDPLGRYSFLAADPFDWLATSAGEVDGLQQLGSRHRRFAEQTVPGLPPFQGGAAGLLSYDLSRSLEAIAPPAHDEFRLPALAIGWYDVVVAVDHRQERTWVISQGFPERDPVRRADRAATRIGDFLRLLRQPAAPAPRPPHALDQLPADRLAPSYPVPGHEQLRGNFSRAGYLRAVQQVVDCIHAGDAFQVNLAQRLLHRADRDPRELYLRLRTRNPATFAGYFELGDGRQILSASPERFLQLRGRQVETRPIKGTRRRTRQPEADLFAGADLRTSQKDLAENVMIVDLLRNDLSRVCRPESVRVSQLCGLESYAYVQHLVSAVHGTLCEDAQPWDLLRAAFPGGSITGAPKVRAMQIIAELEPTVRGPYCGSLGYLGFDGSMDWNILIRTITSARGWWQFPVGGGIVAQSLPEAEYEETWQKAEGLLRAL